MQMLWGYLVEEEGSASRASEAGRDELRAIGQDGVTVGTGEEARAPDVVQEDAPHVASGTYPLKHIVGFVR